MPPLFCTVAPEEPGPQTSFVCDWLAGSKSVIHVGFLFLLMLFAPEENGVISTKSSSPGQAERSGFCAKTLTTS